MSLQDAVFILGAGASASLNFPIGSKLREMLLGTTFQEVNEHFGFSSVEKFQNLFRESMAMSIDGFLQRCGARPDCKEIAPVGMASIAAALLPSEWNCANTRDTDWYMQLFGELTDPANEGIRSSPLRVITFNYDRTFEWFFSRAFRVIHGLNAEEAVAKFRETIDIEHVYGQLGHLPDFHPGEDAVPFGARKAAFKASKSINIIGRSKATELHKKLEAAKVIVFVGFGFLEENVLLLGLDKLDAKTIVSTGRGIYDGTRHFMAARFAQHVWFFGPEGEMGEASKFFRATDLFRLLRNTGELAAYAKKHRYEV